MTLDGDPCYQAIRRYYGDRRARRSGVPFMHHIDEGLHILDAIGASLDARRAFCLHPFAQDGATPDGPIDATAVALAAEYARVAGATPSTRELGSPADIPLSALGDVNDMLVADKVQNRKDFELHHQAHPRAGALARYFHLWLARLGVSETRYRELAALIQVPPCASR